MEDEPAAEAPGAPSFRWLFPGERRLGRWAAHRVESVQGDRRDLLAGAYLLLAALWGSIGGLMGLIGIGLDFADRDGNPWLLAALALIAISFGRILQSLATRQDRAGGGHP